MADTFGKTDIGGSNYNSWEMGDCRVCKFTSPASGTITSITAYFNPITAGADWIGVIYSDNAGAPNALLAVSSVRTDLGTGANWYTFTNVNYDMSLNEVLHIGVKNVRTVAGSNWAIYYAAGAAGQTNTRDYFGSPTNPFGAVEDSLAYECSIYATYTPTGGQQLFTLINQEDY